MPITTMHGDPLSILGLGGNPETTPDCVQIAAAAGVNWFLFYDATFAGLIEGLVQLLPEGRERVFIATGSESRDHDALERYLDETCRRLDVDVIDLFLVEYVNPKDDRTAVFGDDGALELLARWKGRGRIRYAGASVHDRDLAVDLVDSGRIDLLMHRYNMAHRKSEERVLPAARSAGVPVLGFTSTRWGTLLQGHPDWEGAVPKAADCYRFVLDNPAVMATFTSPATVAQLRDNLAVLASPSLLPGQREEWERYGALVYGDGTDSFETDWP